MPTPKVVEKPLPRTGKRNGHEADTSDSWGGQTGGDRGGRGGRGRGGYGTEAGMLLLPGIYSRIGVKHLPIIVVADIGSSIQRSRRRFRE